MLFQIAAFVDAGYLFAQGSTALEGQKQPRHNVQLVVQEVVAALEKVAKEVAPNSRLLRIYWYDGVVRGGRLTAEQTSLANAALTKLRLGVVNGHGQQKGVDSLIVTDLIDLARNRAITDALLLAGDEDLRVGVQIAQTFGVQIHLLGIQPARGSQSPDLIQESDTHHEWDKDTVSNFLSVKQDAPPDAEQEQPEQAPAAEPAKVEYSVQVVEQEIETTIANAGEQSFLQHVEAFRLDASSVPFELDGPTLGRLRHRIGRDLEREEVREYRRTFHKRLQAECDK